MKKMSNDNIKDSIINNITDIGGEIRLKVNSDIKID